MTIGQVGACRVCGSQREGWRIHDTWKSTYADDTWLCVDHLAALSDLIKEPSTIETYELSYTMSWHTYWGLPRFDKAT